MAENEVKTTPEQTPAEESFDIEAEKKTYLKKLKKWRIIKYICFFAAFMTGLVLGSVKDNMVFYIPAFVFGIAGGPLLHAFAPMPHEKLAGRLKSDEYPTSTGMLFIIFLALLVLGYVMMTSDAASAPVENSGSSEDVSSSAEAESE